jgi:hypothetical protein
MGIDEVNRGPFVSPIGRRTPHAIHILRADLIIVDEVSMLTPWVANKVSKILQWIGDEALEFGGMKFLFVGDLLQLPPVVPGFAMPVVQRLITRLRCWPDIRKFRLGRPMRATDPHWNELLEILAKGEQDSLPTWTGLRQFGVTVTDDTEAAFRFFCAGVVAAQPFPLDRQWISPTNRLATEINRKVHEWRRSGGARVLGICHARSELSEPVRPGHGLSLQHQMDYIEDVDLPDLPPSQLELLEGDALMLLRNINTRAGLAKGKRCRAQDMGLMTVVVRFENGQECTFGRVRMEKTLDGVTFVRCQVPFRKVYAGTVHRAQGRTLSRVVIDCRTKWWEHGQVYVGFSRVTSPRDLCVLIPEERHADRIEAVVDRDVVNIVEAIGREAGQAGGRAAAPEGAQDPDADALYPSAVEGDPPRPDPEGLGYAESDADFAHDDGQMTDLHESSSAEDSE